jgi:hypothetical protein
MYELTGSDKKDESRDLELPGGNPEEIKNNS